MARNAAPAAPGGMSSAGGRGTSALPVLLVATMMIGSGRLPAPASPPAAQDPSPASGRPPTST